MDNYIQVFNYQGDPVFVQLSSGAGSWTLPSQLDLSSLVCIARNGADGIVCYVDTRDGSLRYALPRRTSAAAKKFISQLEPMTRQESERFLGPFDPDQSMLQQRQIEERYGRILRKSGSSAPVDASAQNPADNSAGSGSASAKSAAPKPEQEMFIADSQGNFQLATLREGVLNKLATVSGRNWKTRHCRLTTVSFLYFESAPKSGDPAKGEILIDARGTVKQEDVREGFGFRYTSPANAQSLVLAARTSIERDLWMERFSVACSLAAGNLLATLSVRTLASAPDHATALQKLALQPPRRVTVLLTKGAVGTIEKNRVGCLLHLFAETHLELGDRAATITFVNPPHQTVGNEIQAILLSFPANSAASAFDTWKVRALSVMLSAPSSDRFRDSDIVRTRSRSSSSVSVPSVSALSPQVMVRKDSSNALEAAAARRQIKSMSMSGFSPRSTIESAKRLSRAEALEAYLQETTEETPVRAGQADPTESPGSATSETLPTTFAPASTPESKPPPAVSAPASSESQRVPSAPLVTPPSPAEEGAEKDSKDKKAKTLALYRQSFRRSFSVQPSAVAPASHDESKSVMDDGAASRLAESIAHSAPHDAISSTEGTSHCGRSVDALVSKSELPPALSSPPHSSIEEALQPTSEMSAAATIVGTKALDSTSSSSHSSLNALQRAALRRLQKSSLSSSSPSSFISAALPAAVGPADPAPGAASAPPAVSLSTLASQHDLAEEQSRKETASDAESERGRTSQEVLSQLQQPAFGTVPSSQLSTSATDPAAAATISEEHVPIPVTDDEGNAVLSDEGTEDQETLSYVASGRMPVGVQREARKDYNKKRPELSSAGMAENASSTSESYDQRQIPLLELFDKLQNKPLVRRLFDRVAHRRAVGSGKATVRVLDVEAMQTLSYELGHFLTFDEAKAIVHTFASKRKGSRCDYLTYEDFLVYWRTHPVFR